MKIDYNYIVHNQKTSLKIKYTPIGL